jgi:hypothetical protein
MDQPNLLEEFAIGSSIATSDPAIVTMANAKWMSTLLVAISESGSEESIKNTCIKYKELASTLLSMVGADQNDPRLLNLALNSITTPSTTEIRKTGRLTGEWLGAYSDAIKSMPAFFKPYSSPVMASTSMGMTLSNHYVDLYELTNEFSFLRNPKDVVSWAHNLIHNSARKTAAIISPNQDEGSAYQNQLNVNRKLFKSVYKQESKQWKEMFEFVPESVALYPDGIQLTGVETRFNEQVKAIQELLEISSPNIPQSRSR